MDGLKFYFMPNWTRIKDIEVWRDAAVQVFYSFGIGLYLYICLCGFFGVREHNNLFHK